MAPYDEDEIVQLITEIYQLHIKLCTIEADQVAFPPDGGHYFLHEEICASLRIDPVIVSLMKRLPYPKEREMQLEFCLLPGGCPLVYTHYQDMYAGRDTENAPMFGMEPLDLTYTLPHDIALTIDCHRDGYSTILDTKESNLCRSSRDFLLAQIGIYTDTIRLYGVVNPPPSTEDHPRERPQDPAHYRNWIPRDASEYLRDVVDTMKTLTIIPSGVWPFYEFFNDETGPRTRKEMKEIIESYGWPDQFRREEWKSRMKEHWEEVWY